MRTDREKNIIFSDFGSILGAQIESKSHAKIDAKNGMQKRGLDSKTLREFWRVGVMAEASG